MEAFLYQEIFKVDELNLTQMLGSTDEKEVIDTDFAISGSIEVMMSCLNHILKIPQHHYFIGSNYTWCLCLTFEGEMCFGVKPD